MVKQLRNIIIRLSVVYIALAAIMLLPGIKHGDELFSVWIITLVFVLLSVFLRPLLIALTLPFLIMTAGLFLLAIDGFLLLLTSQVTSLEVSNLGWALLASVVMGIVNIGVESIFKRLGWEASEFDVEPVEVKRPGLLLRIALLAGLLFGILFSLFMALQFGLLVSKFTGSLPIVFGAAFLAMLLISFSVAWLITGGLAAKHRVIISSAVGVLSTGLVVALTFIFILQPLSVQPITKQPGQDLKFWDLPTGSRIAYYHYPAAGEPNSVPIVFLHGGPGWAVLAGDRDFYSQFAQDGFDVYLYDQVGTGQSDYLESIASYDAERNLADLDAIREAIGVDRMLLIGQGAGAELATHYLSRHPERVAGMVLQSPTPLWHDSDFFEEFNRTASPLGQIPSLEMRPVAAGFMAGFGPEAAESLVPQPEEAAWFTNNFAQGALVCAGDQDKAPKPDVPFNYYVQVRAEMDQQDLGDPRPGLENRLTRVILMTSECDFIPWASIRQYQDALVNDRTFYFEGAGHTIHLSQPELAAEVIRAFLNGTEYPIQEFQGNADPRPLIPELDFDF